MRIHRAACVLVFLVAAITPALAWPPGTHAYIAEKLKHGADPIDVMFGSMAPDINQVLSIDQLSPYFYATHYSANAGYTDQGFLDLWYTGQQMSTREAHSLAFGFATHNEEWGADYYAHIKSHLYPGYSNPQYPGQNGYVWVKAGQLCRLMKVQLKAAGIDNPILDVLLSDTMNCHFVVEYGMDLLLKATRDPLIGSKLLAAVQQHDAATMQSLFVATYTQEISGVTMGTLMAGAEPLWSEVLKQYGTALDLPMDQAIPAVAAFLEALAEQQEIVPPLPPEQKQQLTLVIELGLIDSLGLCAPDFNPELDLTVKSVRSNLAEHGVRY